MQHLSRDLSRLRLRYDAVVVGSGYGGGVVADNLARAGLSVAVLERGPERQPGEFPRGLAGALREVQWQTRRRRGGRAKGLFDFRISDDAAVLVGCGLGGTSLINAGIAAEPAAQVFSRGWPAELSSGPDDALRAGYARAAQMLGSKPYRRDALVLPKLVALEAAAKATGVECTRPGINVTFASGRNAAGVVQPACTLCGDCVTGCNVGAKNTVLVTYLADAAARGAEIFCEAEVDSVRRLPDGGWHVELHRTGRSRSARRVVEARVVVLAAGALGSSEILTRSRARGLPTSALAGARISGNGDYLGFAYDCNQSIDGIGRGDRVDPRRPIGPSIAGMVDLRGGRPPGAALVVEEGAIPSPLARLAPVGLLVAAATSVRAWLRNRGNKVLLPRWGAAGRTLTLLAVGVDGDSGSIRLTRDRAVLDWMRTPSGDGSGVADGALALLAGAAGGTYVPNPMSANRILPSRYLTVHPLGGCDMADDATQGVVDHAGRVFSGTSGTEVHAGLYVADGSVVPTPLAVNPLLTIAALAERTSGFVLSDLGLSSGTAPPEGGPPTPPDPTSRPAVPVGLRFEERMRGRSATPSHRRARMSLDLEVHYDDVDALLRDPSVAARVRGTVAVKSISHRPLTVVDGAFQLFVAAHDVVDTSRMRYRLALEADDGRRFTLTGEKSLHDDDGIDIWGDTTVLPVRITDVHGALAVKGRVRIGLLGLARLLLTLRTVDAPDHRAARAKRRRFLASFARTLFLTYGKALTASDDFRRARFPAPPDRPLRLPAPERRWHAGGAWHDTAPERPSMHLERYRGGTRGPVMLAPGFAMAASGFRLPTVDTNLVEYLVERGFDVWLFDYRAGIDLPSACDDFTIDDVARHDWPPAVAEVRRVTGAASVQVVAHCVGSMSLLMSLLAGLEGVRSAVCSQVTVHPRMHWFAMLKIRAGVGEMLEAAGVKTLAPGGDAPVDRVLDVAFRANPLLKGERCHNPVCRWVFGFFGPTHVHDRLDAATHARLGSMFGVANLRALQHIATIVRAGRAVDSEGRDTYMSHPERLRMPISFLVGVRNRIFLPAGTDATLSWLSAANGPEWYERVVLTDYAHLDGFIGKDAARDVYPRILRSLEHHDALLGAV